MLLVTRNTFQKFLHYSSNRSSANSVLSPSASNDLEMNASAVQQVDLSASQNFLAGVLTACKAGYNAFVDRGRLSVGIPIGLHTLSMVARQALPAYVVSPPQAIAVNAEKITLSLIAPALVKYLVNTAYSTTKENQDNTLYRNAKVAVLLALSADLGFASLASFPAAEATALCIAAAGAGVQSKLKSRPIWMKKALAVACIAATIIGREGATIATTRVTTEAVAPPFKFPPLACNDAVENCKAQWCDVVFPSTHNSMAEPVPFAHVIPPLSWAGYYASNQDGNASVEQQFTDGIDGFLLEFYENDAGEYRTSHNTVFDIEPFETTLGRFEPLLAENPRRFIVLQISPQQKLDYAQKMIDIFDRTGLGNRTAAGVRGANTKTPLNTPPCALQMESMLDAGIQVAVSFGVRENTFSANTIRDITCINDGSLDSNDSKKQIVTWNFFVSLAFKSVSVVVNQFLPKFVEQCTSTGTDVFDMPTLLAVNHYRTSNVVLVANALNRKIRKRLGTPLPV